MSFVPDPSVAERLGPMVEEYMRSNAEEIRAAEERRGPGDQVIFTALERWAMVRASNADEGIERMLFIVDRFIADDPCTPERLDRAWAAQAAASQYGDQGSSEAE